MFSVEIPSLLPPDPPKEWPFLESLADLLSPQYERVFRLVMLPRQGDSEVGVWVTSRHYFTDPREPLDLSGGPNEYSRRQELGERQEVLEEIARVTRGRVVGVDKLNEVVRSLADLPDPPPSVRRVQLWSHPALAGSLVLLMGVFWVGRKVIGLI